MMIKEQSLNEIAQVYAARKENRELNPWEYDARAFMEKYGTDARIAAWNLYCASESLLSRWRTELDAMLKSPGEQSEGQRDLAQACVCSSWRMPRLARRSAEKCLSTSCSNFLLMIFD